MTDPAPRVISAYSNNAVLARVGGAERVLVGRGIGFGKRPGDELGAVDVQQQFMEVNPDEAQFLGWMRSLGEDTVRAISDAVDVAVDALGDLDPSVYLLLTDHLSFAVQRFQAGEPIANPLLGVIRAVFPPEFAAGRLALHHLQQRLGLDLPLDEAAYIALHLHAARTGGSIHEPLRAANALATVARPVANHLGLDTPDQLDDEELLVLTKLVERLQEGRLRRNAAQHSIERDLAEEFRFARQVIARLLDVPDVPRGALGEVAHLAVHLDGWRQTHQPTGRRAGVRKEHE